MKSPSILKALFVFLPFLGSCEWTTAIPWTWKTYEHPTYRFTLKVPRTWKTETSGVMGAQAVFLAPEEDPIFRASANIVVQAKDPRRPSLKDEVGLSLRQLQLLLNGYRLLSEAPARLGNLDAYELRGSYRAAEGERLIRTLIAFDGSRIFVFTFTCREEREAAFQDVVKRMIASFRSPPPLSPSL